MLVVPPCFQDALREWIKISLPRSVPLSACRFCDEWVQVTHLAGQVVFNQNWAQVVYKYDLHIGDVVVFKLQAFALKMIIYRRGLLHRHALHLPWLWLGGGPFI
jgi:hypothetical protein